MDILILTIISFVSVTIGVICISDSIYMSKENKRNR